MSKLIFRIQENTDNVDIDQKCLGLSVWVPGDSVNLLNDNRGLHVQIRHNQNKETFEAANQLSKLLKHSPDLLRLARLVIETNPGTVYLNGSDGEMYAEFEALDQVIKKIEGRV